MKGISLRKWLRTSDPALDSIAAVSELALDLTEARR